MVVLLPSKIFIMNPISYLLITGASSGIGREMAIQLSRRYNIIVNGRNGDELQKTLEFCDKSKTHLIWQYDLLKLDSLENEFTRFLVENNCIISNYVHSAGYMRMVPFKMISVELFKTTFSINTVSVALITKVLTKKRINQDALKSLVFISSNISNFGAKAFSVYAASKAAVDGLMRCLAVELAPNVRVNSVLPGSVRTAMTEHIYEDTKLMEKMGGTYPLGLGTSRDIYEAVNYLLSDESRWITGQQLVVDGGRTINITG
jgi:NAD(P)-dependent dehydrogenase (short-subunit alcohol dehydrogenase family)